MLWIGKVFVTFIWKASTWSKQKSVFWKGLGSFGDLHQNQHVKQQISRT